MDTFDKTLDRLTTLSEFTSERSATDTETAQMEAELNVVLPAQYIRFLKRFGYAGWSGHEVLGISPIDPITGRLSEVISDCVKRSKKERRNRYGTALLQSNIVVVATDGGGGNFVLFCVGSPHEGEVHWYNLEDSPEPHTVWQTLQDYLEYEITNALEG